MTLRAVLELFAAGIALSAQATALAAERPDQATGADLECSYRSQITHDDVETFKHCAWLGRDGHLHLVPRHLRRLSYDKYGLASVYVDQWYKVRRDGGTAPVMTVDNWAEPFSDGRARSPVGKKIGYIDRDLKLAVPARYDGAFPFEDGIAVVCVGCKLVSDGEHTHYEGGMWGCVDRSGLERGPFRPRAPNESSDAVCPRLHEQHSVPTTR